MRYRFRGAEYMDSLSGLEPGVALAARELVHVNRHLGGYRAVRRVVKPYFRLRAGDVVKVLDLGAGLADVAADLVRFGAHLGVTVRVTAVEGNPLILRTAQSYLEESVPRDVRRNISLVAGDVWRLDETDERYDVAIATLFLHHMNDEESVALLRKMDLLARHGIVVVDLHRHRFALAAISLLARLFRASPVFRHDAAVSVRRGFRRSELRDLAARANLKTPTIRWRWAFRWTLSTIQYTSPVPNDARTD